ncbi:hypothetical protein [Pseudomonas sp. LP_7_YM]|uniref:hypothetical protein n=1 Tax=Pseudomonas sp. LP_7_YM TaxID=2485137 RepID=UPI00105CCCAB|nr:hypothetical protein [Pseudomonas sp. LP_7_YM]TDV61243.1 hypothetical protein EC915_10930 [Pseudomonas sp. LP_7_YM]
MAMFNYGPAGSNLSLNGITISSFGDTDPPIVIEDIEPRAALKRGTSGGSIRLDNVTRAKQLTVNLLPGSDEARQIIALDKARVDFYGAFNQSGSGESLVFYGGILTKRGPIGRGGKTSVSDDQFIFEFNDSEEI